MKQHSVTSSGNVTSGRKLPVDVFCARYQKWTLFSVWKIAEPHVPQIRAPTWVSRYRTHKCTLTSTQMPPSDTTLRRVNVAQTWWRWCSGFCHRVYSSVHASVSGKNSVSIFRAWLRTHLKLQQGFAVTDDLIIDVNVLNVCYLTC